MRILFVSANPDWTPRLDLLDELRELKQSLKGKKYELELLPAAQPEDLKEAIEGSGKTFDVIHFSGHATQKHGLLFRQSNGMKKAITAKDLCTYLAKKPVKLAVLNACHTWDTAKGIKDVANTVIGTTGKLQEEAAKKMTKVLYAALATLEEGASIDDAIKEATDAIKKTGLENVYKSTRSPDARPAVIAFDEGDVEIDPDKEEAFDRYFFERYLDDQIDAIQKNVKLNYIGLGILLALGVVILTVSWGEHIVWALKDFARDQSFVGHFGHDIVEAMKALGKGLVGMAGKSLSETPLLEWLTGMGEAIPIFIASMQHRWCVHGNEKLRELRALRDLVENSEQLSDTLRARLHKILDQSVRAADIELTTNAEELSPEEAQAEKA